MASTPVKANPAIRNPLIAEAIQQQMQEDAYLDALIAEHEEDEYYAYMSGMVYVPGMGYV